MEVPEVSSSDVCFNHVTSWLENCISSHSLCQRTHDSRPLPTRVINVGSAEGQEPYLYESRGQTGQYVALSYCWGDSKTNKLLKTTSDNLEEHKRHINFASLPQTLKDALTITRRLNIQYIWIDALCIIQGDADDWARESSKMCEVYSNAYLTIACNSSPGSSHGIFHKQSYSAAVEIPYRDTTIAVRKILAQEHNNYMTLMRHTDTIPEPINCRAWTFQEALLSNRIIYYTDKELKWECNEWRYCECEHGSANIETNDDMTSRFLRRPHLFETLPLAEIHTRWNDLVVLFSMRSMAYEEDKLPALSGLANSFAAVLQVSLGYSDQYLAGIWRSSFAESLLWSITEDAYIEDQDPETLKSEYLRTKEWRAPSWSWASVKGTVQLAPRRQFKSALEIVETSCALATIDPYGRLKSARLLLRGCIVHDLTVVAKCLPGPAEHVWNFGTTQGRRHYVQYKGTLLPFMCDYAGVEWGSSEVSADPRCVSILLTGLGTTSKSLVPTREEFLVLQKVKTQSEEDNFTSYKRIGVWTRSISYLDGYNHQSEVPEQFEIFKNASEETFYFL